MRLLVGDTDEWQPKQKCCAPTDGNTTPCPKAEAPGVVKVDVHAVNILREGIGNGNEGTVSGGWALAT
jgi:hypothetical protein